LTTNQDIDPNFGTRHRAAYGISERVDSVVLVVSEERGQISMVESNGNLTRNMRKEDLIKVLETKFTPEKSTTIAEQISSFFNRWRKKA
jgi:diadenylate cyclase